MGRIATESSDFTTCASVVRTAAGKLWTRTGTAVVAFAPTAMVVMLSDLRAARRAAHFFLGERLRARMRLLYLRAWRSMRSRASLMAAIISGASAAPTMGWSRTGVGISALWRGFFSPRKGGGGQIYSPGLFCFLGGRAARVWACR